MALLRDVGYAPVEAGHLDEARIQSKRAIEPAAPSVDSQDGIPVLHEDLVLVRAGCTPDG